MPIPKRYADQAAKQRAYRTRVALARRQEQEAEGLSPPPTVASRPGERRWSALLQRAQAALQMLRDEMDAYAMERSEAWQEGERAEQLQARLEVLDEVLERLEEVQP